LHKQCTLLWICIVPHVDLVYQEMVCEVFDLNGREGFDFLEKFYVHRQQYYACGTKYKPDYTHNQLQVTAEMLDFLL
jgi:hypothetical protein